MIKRYLITTVALVSLVTSQAYCEPLITPKWSDYCRADNNKLIECYLTVKQIEEGKESDRRNYMIMSSMAAQQARQTQQLQGINRTLQGY